MLMGLGMPGGTFDMILDKSDFQVYMQVILI